MQNRNIHYNQAEIYSQIYQRAYSLHVITVEIYYTRTKSTFFLTYFYLKSERIEMSCSLLERFSDDAKRIFSTVN